MVCEAHVAVAAAQRVDKPQNCSVGISYLRTCFKISDLGNNAYQLLQENKKATNLKTTTLNNSE